MLRLSRARVIGDIEFIVGGGGPILDRKKWIAKGAGCSVDRFSFAGDAYNFQLRVLQVRLPATERPSWKLVILSQSWEDDGGKPIYATKWLKLIVGKPNDVLKWIKMSLAETNNSSGT